LVKSVSPFAGSAQARCRYSARGSACMSAMSRSVAASELDTERIDEDELREPRSRADHQLPPPPPSRQNRRRPMLHSQAQLVREIEIETGEIIDRAGAARSAASCPTRMPGRYDPGISETGDRAMAAPALDPRRHAGTTAAGRGRRSDQLKREVPAIRQRLDRHFGIIAETGRGFQTCRDADDAVGLSPRRTKPDMLLRIRSITYLAARINGYELVDPGGDEPAALRRRAHISVRLSEGWCATFRYGTTRPNASAIASPCCARARLLATARPR